MEAVKHCSHNLKWVENQTEEICMEAVRQNGLDLKFVKIKQKQSV